MKPRQLGNEPREERDPLDQYDPDLNVLTGQCAICRGSLHRCSRDDENCGRCNPRIDCVECQR